MSFLPSYPALQMLSSFKPAVLLGLRNIFVVVVVASVGVETGDVGAALKGVVAAAVIDGLVVPFHEVPEKVCLYS
jgi:hypothetical protein